MASAEIAGWKDRARQAWWYEALASLNPNLVSADVTKDMPAPTMGLTGPRGKEHGYSLWIEDLEAAPACPACFEFHDAGSDFVVLADRQLDAVCPVCGRSSTGLDGTEESFG